MTTSSAISIFGVVGLITASICPCLGFTTISTPSNKLQSPVGHAVVTAKPSFVLHDTRLFASTAAATSSGVPAPTFDGKLVFPMRALSAGLRGHDGVSSVYAVLNSSYRRSGGDWAAWEACEYIGVTRNMNAALQGLLQQHGPQVVAHVRAVSFQYPQRSSMEDLAQRWVGLSRENGGNALTIQVVEEEWEISDEDAVEAQRLREIEASKYLFDEDDDEDDDEYDDEFDDGIDMAVLSTPPTSPDTVVSPFSSSEVATPSESSEETGPPALEGVLVFSKKNVDQVLEEVRPYLISDGGNVSVHSVDDKTKNVYLILEGACGSCPSSTVTMQMGIERVLREAFVDLGDVVQVEDPNLSADEKKPTELTMDAVQAEVKRLSPALSAMGGVIQIISVDPIGVVEMSFRGSNKIRHGLELAMLDVPFVKHVKFVS